MLFNSFEFLVFFPLVLLVYYLIPKNAVVYMMLLASALFYSFFIPAYLLILLLVILVDYFSALGIEKYPDKRNLLLALSIISNLGILFVFKYYNFFVSTSNDFFGTDWILLKIILPIGLSFHTFQSLSYVIEIYKGRYKAERHPAYFALYVMYFPQLVAGPIETPQKLLPQLRKAPNLDWENIWSGLRLLLWGLFKKVVIADRISFYVNGIFEHTSDYNSAQVALGVFFFTIQIYCDFSGYSDMAVGISKCFGIDLMFNFNRPLLARNIKDLWSRWHISLYQWFMQYIYIPLGGSRKGVAMMCFNVLLIFLVSGFWHGAGFNFILWGLLNGIFILLYLLVNRFIVADKPILPAVLSIALTFGIVALIFVLFRSKDLSQAQAIYSSLWHFKGPWIITGTFDQFPFGTMNLSFVFLMIVCMFVLEAKVAPNLSYFALRPKTDFLFCTILVLLIFFTGVFTKQNFIYFQF